MSVSEKIERPSISVALHDGRVTVVVPRGAMITPGFVYSGADLKISKGLAGNEWARIRDNLVAEE